MHMEQLSVIIVNWNTGNLLKKCVESLIALPELSAIRHIAIVDNASSDNSYVIPVYKQRGNIVLLQQKANLGFAKANNIAWEYIKKHGGKQDHILLLNPDTEVQAGAIESMLDALVRNPKAGIIGPKLIETNGSVQMSVRSFPSLGIFMLFFLKLHRVFSSSPLWKKYMMKSFDYNTEQTVDQVMGAAFLIRNSVLQKIGLLDESFWIWFEEVDYCKRAQDADWNTVYTPNATIFHYGNISFQQVSGLKKAALFNQSSLLYAKKHLGFTAYILLLALYPIGIIIAMLAMLFQARKQKNTISTI